MARTPCWLVPGDGTEPNKTDSQALGNFHSMGIEWGTRISPAPNVTEPGMADRQSSTNRAGAKPFLPSQ